MQMIEFLLGAAVGAGVVIIWALRRPGRRDMSKKGHKGPHVTEKSDNPAMPEIKKLDLKPGDHVILLVRQVKGLSDGPGALIEKEYIFIKKVPAPLLF